MPDYFNRYLRLTFKINSVADPITIDQSWKVTFSVKKYAAVDIMGFNTAEISVYNMSPALQDTLAVRGASLKLEAGYDQFHSCIFTGIINNVVTVKQATELITTFYCQSDMSAHAESVEECMQNISVTDYIKHLCEKFGVSYVLPFTKSDVVRESFTGSFRDVISKICYNYDISIALDNGTLVFRDKKAKVEDIPNYMIKVFTPTSGLIGNPTVIESGIRFKALLQPELKVNDYFRLEAPYADYNLNELEKRPNAVLGTELNTLAHVTTRNYNGVYMALSLVFSGDTRGNDWCTTVEGARLGFKQYA